MMRRWPGAPRLARRALAAGVRLLVGALIATGPAVLVTLAYASPPDATWVSGIYDGADFDDVVALLLSASGATGSGPVAHVRPTPPAADHPPAPARPATPLLLLSRLHPRAPPLAA